LGSRQGNISQNGQNTCSPIKGIVQPSLGFNLKVAYILKTSAYLVKLKFDTFDVVLSGALSHLNCVLGDFHMTTDTLV